MAQKLRLAHPFQGVNWSVRLLCDTLTGRKIPSPNGTLLESKHENVVVLWRPIGAGMVELVAPPTDSDLVIGHVYKSRK